MEYANGSNHLLNNLDSTSLDEVDKIENYAENEGNGHKDKRDKEILEAANRLLIRRRQQLACEINIAKENDN